MGQLEHDTAERGGETYQAASARPESQQQPQFFIGGHVAGSFPSARKHGSDNAKMLSNCDGLRIHRTARVALESRKRSGLEPLISVRQYSPMVYAYLHNVSAFTGNIASLQPTIDRLGATIERHELDEHIGVALIHKHFNLFDDECLLRRRTDQTMIVSPASGATDQWLPVVWAFGKTKLNEPYGCYPLEFMEKSADSEAFEPTVARMQGDREFLQEYFDVLANAGATSYLGLGLNLARLFSVPDGYRLLEAEAPHLGDRTLKLEVLPEADFSGAVLIQTLCCSERGNNHGL